jgi:uncharacterized protein (DUF1015 family)
MIQIQPFKGIRYNLKRVMSLDRVVTPPYDIISPQKQRHYHRLHPYNFIRLELGLIHSKDNDRSNRYQRAQKILDRWLRLGILKTDPSLSLYPYQQIYRLNGKSYRRWGMLALVHLGNSKICPHEETREEPLMDRLRLIQATHASLSPIFGLVPDEDGRYIRWLKRVCRRRSLASVCVDGVWHRLWRVSDPKMLTKVQQLLAAQSCLVIADGHHRWEAACRFRLAQRHRSDWSDPHAGYHYAMFYLVSAHGNEPGLLPTHRVIWDVSAQKVRRLEKTFHRLGSRVYPAQDVETAWRLLCRLRRQGRVGVGIWTPVSHPWVLTADGDSHHRLDVEWLHRVLLPQWFRRLPTIAFTHEIRPVIHEILGRKRGMLCLMQPPQLTEIFRWAKRNRRMPGKSTYFYPKPIAGLVEYRFQL